MKRFFFSLIFAFIALSSFAQNIQLHYDFGSALYKSGSKSLNTNNPDVPLYSRPTLTTTVEMFRPDSWGNTFFFVDMNYGPVSGKSGGVQGAYWEVSRELKFWDAPFLAHIEYNGGMDISTGSYNDAWLVGPTWAVASKDFSKTFSLSLMYKAIPRNVKNVHNFQITGVWNIYFAAKRFLFSGFADFWMENRPWQVTKHSGSDGTDFIFVSEPQIWYNFNTIKKMEKFNLSVGSEVEISNNFVGPGFYCIPTLAVKWTF